VNSSMNTDFVPVLRLVSSSKRLACHLGFRSSYAAGNLRICPSLIGTEWRDTDHGGTSGDERCT
jgi:hypothetical protein